MTYSTTTDYLHNNSECSFFVKALHAANLSTTVAGLNGTILVPTDQVGVFMYHMSAACASCCQPCVMRTRILWLHNTTQSMTACINQLGDDGSCALLQPGHCILAT